MDGVRTLLRDDEWRDALAAYFNGLVPDDQPDSAGAAGWLAAAQLGSVSAFHVAGSSQVLRRSPARARQRPTDLLKVCIQRAGTATIQQGDRKARLTPGSMAIYDIDKPYGICLEGEWRCALIAFPRGDLIASERFIAGMICRPTPVSEGPGSVLIPLVASAVTRQATIASGSVLADALMGRATLDLLRAAFAEQRLPDQPDAVRLQIEAYIQAHIAEPDLSHAKVAAAHHMSERTLHRLFGDGHSVTDLIRSYRLDGIRGELTSPASAGDTISRIAARWGIHDMPYLSRTFRARFGKSPSEARHAAGPAGHDADR
jgi:AraC-like DNA-binding protein